MSSIANDDLGRLQADHLHIIYDDIRNKRGTFFGFAENVSPHNVNLMTKLGKGLIYVCITETKAKQLGLPHMFPESHDARKAFGISVDYKTTTTGISAFERADTIRAFTSDKSEPEDFRRPGHIFPLIAKNDGLMERIGIAEAAVYLAELNTGIPVSYTCEILDPSGDIASKEYILGLAQEQGITVIAMSDIMRYKYEHTDLLQIYERSEIRVDGHTVSVYKLNIPQFELFSTVYLQQDGCRSGEIAIHHECQLGDTLGIVSQCQCRRHLRDYFADLLAGRLCGVVFHQGHRNAYLPEEINLINQQIETFIGNQKCHKKTFNP